MRHDGVDAETGTGLEVGAGVRYTGGPLTIEGAVRTLVAHEESGYRDWGAIGAIQIAAGASRRGLSFRLAPTWGNASSQAGHLWSVRDAAGLVQDEEFEAKGRLEAELGYGIALRGTRGLLTPYAALSWTDGARWTIAPQPTLGLEWTDEPGRAASSPPGNVLALRTEVRW